MSVESSTDPEAASSSPARRSPVADPGPGEALRRRIVARKVAAVLIIGVFTLALWQAQTFVGLGKWFPQLAAALGLAVAIVHALMVLFNKDVGKAAFDTGNEDMEFHEGLERLDIPQWWVMVGLVAFPVLTVVVGFIPAVIIWMPLFFHYIAGHNWWVSIAEMLGTLAALYVLHFYIGMVFPLSWFVGA